MHINTHQRKATCTHSTYTHKHTSSDALIYDRLAVPCVRLVSRGISPRESTLNRVASDYTPRIHYAKTRSVRDDTESASERTYSTCYTSWRQVKCFAVRPRVLKLRARDCFRYPYGVRYRVMLRARVLCCSRCVRRNGWLRNDCVAPMLAKWELARTVAVMMPPPLAHRSALAP